MHKLTRYSAAVLLSLSMASAGMMTAYADETTDYSQVGPGFDNNAPASGESSGTVIIRTSDSDGGSQTQTDSSQTQPGQTAQENPQASEIGRAHV